MNASNTQLVGTTKPVNLVCDDALLHMINPLRSSKLINCSEPLALSAWLLSDSACDLVLCRVSDKSHASSDSRVLEVIRGRDANVVVVVVVDELSDEAVLAMMDSGARGVIVESEIASGRFALMVHEWFHSGSTGNASNETNAAHAANIPNAAATTAAGASAMNTASSANPANDSAALYIAKEPTVPTAINTIETDVGSSDSVQTSECSSLEIRNSFMSALSDVSMKLMQRMSLDELMDEIAAHAVLLANSDSAFISAVHESGQYMEIRGACGRFAEFKGQRLNKHEDLAGLAWDLQELVLVDHVADDNARELWGDSAKRCAVPYFIEDEFAGVVCVVLDSAEGALDDHLDILTLFTRTVSLAIENTQLIAKQKDELVRNVAIGEITQSFYSAANLSELVDGVCNSLLGVFDAKQITVCKIEKDQKFSLLAEWHNDQGNISRSKFSNVKMMSSSVSQWCVDNKQCALVLNGVEDERDSEAVRRIKKLLGIGCSVSIPLMHDDEVWGVLSLGKDDSKRNFTDVEISLLELLSSQLSNTVVRQNLLDEIHFQAFHDSLTSLPNRLKFEKTLTDLISVANPKETIFALLFLDLDGFKAVNDNQGHTIGDELLKSVARRLAGCLSENDLLARMGGDEFAVLLRGVKSQENANAIALRLSHAVGQIFNVDKYQLKIGVSIGISFFPDNGLTADDLLRNADFAMYEAKATGKGCVRSFNEKMASQYRSRIELEQDLLKALEGDQFELYYQPKVNLAANMVTGVEALIRWNHPRQGYVSPEDFITLATEAGYITEIGKWVLNEAVRQNSIWIENGLRDLVMAVNISAPQFSQDDFIDGVLQTLTAHKLEPALLELEVTESVVKDNVTNVVRTLNYIRDAGISVAVDDFGTGFSSLAYLENLPLDCLKIDKVFVDKLADGNAQNTIVNTIITLARAFGWRTVAEGVENEKQVQQLMSLGCECIQGYYFSRPVTASEVPATIEMIESQFNDIRKAG